MFSISVRVRGGAVGVCGVRWVPWGSVVVRGGPFWVRGGLWGPLGPGESVGVRGRLWASVGVRGRPWAFMGVHGRPMNALGASGRKIVAAKKCVQGWKKIPKILSKQHACLLSTKIFEKKHLCFVLYNMFV